MKAGEMPRLLNAAEAKGRRAGLLEAAAVAAEMLEFVAHETGGEWEAGEAAILEDLIARLRAKAEGEK